MQHSPCGCQMCSTPRPPDCCCPTAPPKPPDCGCHPQPPKHSKPPKACAPQGVLLNKIVASERKLIQSLCTELQVEGIPCCAQSPFTLVMVQQSGAQPWWTPLESQGQCARLCLKVFIPVCCQIRDACGKFFSATAVVEADTCLSPRCPMSDCWRHQIVIVPCVRLCSPPVCSEGNTFCVQLEASLELYFTRMEACFMRPPEPTCPELPLYPQPCQPTPPCWPQCPRDPDPCGWPRQGQPGR